MKKILFSFLLLCNVVLFAQNFPSNPDPDKCYVKVVSKDIYEYRDIEIVKKPQFKILKVIPAQYETITKRVMVRPSYTKYEVVPAVWGKETYSFPNQDPASIIEVQPAVLRSTTEIVEVSPPYGRWEVGGRKPNCFDPDPEACKFWKYKQYPAEYEEYSTKKVVQDATFTTTVGKSSNSSFERSVILEPAQVKEILVPAEYKEVKKKILVKDSRVVEEVSPAITETMPQKVLLKPGGEVTWKAVDCELLDYQPLPIEWEFNSTKLTKIAKATIDATLIPIILYNPGIKVEIASHTDSRGDSGSNKALSEKRAKAVTEYLKSKGIPKDLLVAIGYGESRLKNRCRDGVQCSESQHQANRRTEFKLLER